MLARGGRMSLLGLPDGPVPLDLNDQVIFKEARLLGITGREMFQHGSRRRRYWPPAWWTWDR